MPLPEGADEEFQGESPAVLQRVAVCCIVVQCVAVWCNVVQCDAVHRSMCSVSQCVAVWPATDTFVPFPEGADNEFQKFLEQLRSFRHAKKR